MKRQSCEDIAKKNYFGHALTLPPDDARLPKYHEQRNKRGFDDTELWSLDQTIYRFTLPRLKRYKDILVGYPGCMSFLLEGEYKDFEPEKGNSERCGNLWEFLISEMIFGIEETTKENIKDSDRQRVENGIRLFHEYFNSLWV